MKLIRFIAIAVFAILALSWFSHTPYWKKARIVYSTPRPTPHVLTTHSSKKMQQKAAEARTFVQQKKYNDNICFLIDMTLASGQNRFFIYDLKKDTVQAAGLVAHGNCFQYWLEGRKYSNVVGSGCSSLGKYKIGNSYIGKWGYSYKLHGLDSTNNNAFERTVVLHSHSCVSETEITDEICQSNGCPTVSPGFLQQLKAIINKSDKPVLLWIYE